MLMDCVRRDFRSVSAMDALSIGIAAATIVHKLSRTGELSRFPGCDLVVKRRWMDAQNVSQLPQHGHSRISFSTFDPA